MNFTLQRTGIQSWGVTGTLISESGETTFVTLEHAFPDSTGLIYRPKVPAGTYECVLGTHRLDGGGPIKAFEVMNVPGHTGILVHVGNYNADSNGCILIGTALGNRSISASRAAFNRFMDIQRDQTFTLKVLNA